MKTKQEKIDAIYEKVADKSLTFGCRIILNDINFYKNNKYWNVDFNTKNNYDLNFIVISDEVINLWWFNIFYSKYEWCDIKYLTFSNKSKETISYLEYIFSETRKERKEYSWKKKWYEIIKSKIIEKIIWHPVMIWDVLAYCDMYNLMNKNMHKCIFSDWVINRWENILLLWKDKRLPIEEQSSEAIDYVYNLINN